MLKKKFLDQFCQSLLMKMKQKLFTLQMILLMDWLLEFLQKILIRQLIQLINYRQVKFM